jgi:hypothetical protein
MQSRAREHAVNETCPEPDIEATISRTRGPRE